MAGDSAIIPILRGLPRAHPSLLEFTVGVRADHGNRSLFGKRQEISGVLQQHHGFTGALQGQSVILRSVASRQRDLCIGHLIERIEQSEAEADIQGTRQGAVHIRLRAKPILDSLCQRHIGATAHGHAAHAQVHAILDRPRRSTRGVLFQFVGRPNVGDGIHVGDHIALEAPFAAQDVVEKELARGAGFASEAIVCTHDGPCLAFDDGGFKRWEISLPKILIVSIGVEHMSKRLRPAVNRVMLGSCYRFDVVRVIALKTFHIGDAHACC